LLTRNSWRDLYRLVQNAHYKTGNIRKLEAAVRVYGGLVEVYPEALDKLTNMLLHPIPTLRNKAADTLFTVKGVGKGVNWARAKKEDLGRLREGLNIPALVAG
jgi:tubulin-specific chaperone D